MELAQTASKVFLGDGEMAVLGRNFDWSATPLGSVDSWPVSLRTIVRTLIASRHPMFLWWGPELVQFYNDAYRPSLGEGGRHPRALGARGAEFWTDIWPIIGPQIEGVMSRGVATWHEDQLVPIERNGGLEEVYWTYSYSPVFEEDGSVGGTLVVCTEVTNRMLMTIERERLIVAVQQAQMRSDTARDALARLIDQAPVSVAVLQGPELLVTVANERYQHLLGDRNPVGLRLTDMLPDIANSEIERILKNVYDTGVAFAANDHHIRFDSQGAGIVDNYYDFVYHPLRTDDGSVSAILVLAVDVTDRHRHQEERDFLLHEAQRARREAESANRSKNDFLATMSHELRTPLNAIGGYAELLQLGIHGPISPEQDTALKRIQHSQSHLLGLINNVLDFAKVEAGAVEFALENFALGEFLAQCEALTLPQIMQRGLHFENRGCPSWLAVHADRDKVRQVVLNLLSNAVKFTSVGGTIALSASLAADVRVAISVSDTGDGIPHDELERIFHPFVQVDLSLTRKHHGTGLGLAISRDLARGMGGDLTVESSVGGGSTFTLWLPSSPSRLRSGDPPIAIGVDE
ncbi:MAG: ATP-binding protein [Gemmatimonadaceae bacterium]